MLELAATVTITMLSALLFGYWFRYTCLLILSAKTTRDYAGGVATAHQLGFPGVQRELAGASDSELSRLHASLDRDYKILGTLFDQGGKAPGEANLERRMLQIHYRVMGIWRRGVQAVSPAAARKAIEEMALVVSHFANATGEQACAAAA